MNLDELFEDDIEEELRKIESQGGAYRYYRPLHEAADEFIRFAQNPDLRVFTGIPEFDAVIRGVAPGEFCVINGFAHNGKTVLATEILLANTDTPFVLFTPDETRTAVLTKLAAARTGIGAEELERRVLRGDKEAIDLLRQVADDFKLLVVYDENPTLHMMDVMMREAQDALGVRPKAVMFDYMSQLSEPLEVNQKLDALKAWGKDQKIAFFGLHQSPRSKGAGGQELGIDSGAYGGESQAIFMITVRRKINYYLERLKDLQYKIDNASNRQRISEYEDEIHTIRTESIPRHTDTISIGLVKNKRPPMKLVPEIDFKMDPETGRIVKIEKDSQDDDPDKPLPLTYRSGPSARDLLYGGKDGQETRSGPT